MTNIRLKIVTYEWNGSLWVPVVQHIFYGNNYNNVLANMEAHKISDSFFNASFTGMYNGIHLKNDQGVWK